MPVILLPIATNVTRDDNEQIATLNTLDSVLSISSNTSTSSNKDFFRTMNHEQAQTIVLGALLVVIALLMLAVTAFECYKMNFFGVSSHRESAKVTPTEITSPYSSSSSLAVLVKKSSS
ncbi:hypothetical protein KIN20_014638 [Parelaphostrongylus tenuis]|uniref:Uncharacterized protein n=1 Tax=Parelaphostrongylus tenuis TaxID=148309 RepID=A0AAD5MXK8_PARTN|nr:hypothetical protein KIN20_014638 [Parelaphostrongylus tenuis]